MPSQSKTGTAAKPKVSVIAISYNHENYIKQAFDSFIAQKADFDFEIVVGDDCSTDGTQAIIDEYLARYPSLFRQIKRNKNVGVQRNFIETMQAAKGEYLAICECDDFWTDPQKLQRQVDFLESHPDHTLCFHPVRVFYENNDKKDFIFPEPGSIEKFSVSELLKQNFIQTNSVMYRKQQYNNMPTDILPVDWYLHLYHAKFGKIGFLNEVMSAYRRHTGGLWWDSENDLQSLLKRQGSALVSLYFEQWKLYGDDAGSEAKIFYRASDLINKMREIDKKEGTSLVATAFQAHPDIILPLIRYQVHELQEREATLKNKTQTINEKEVELKQEQRTVEELRNELQRIKKSRSWKLARIIARQADRLRQLSHKSDRNNTRM